MAVAAACSMRVQDCNASAATEDIASIRAASAKSIFIGDKCRR